MAVTCEEFVQSLDTRAQFDRLARHTLSCEKCHNLWRVHQRLTLSGPARPQTLDMSTELTRTLAGAPGAVRGSSRLRRSALVVLPLGVCLALAWRSFARPDLALATTLSFWSGALALAACFGLCLGVLVWRDPDGFSASPALRWACALATLALFPLFAGSPGLHGPEHASVTLPRDCLLFGLVISLALSACAFFAIRRSVFVAPAASGALAGSVGGLGGLLWLHIHCAAGAGLHVLVGHGLAFVLALLVSMLAGRRWLLRA